MKIGLYLNGVEFKLLKFYNDHLTGLVKGDIVFINNHKNKTLVGNKYRVEEVIYVVDLDYDDSEYIYKKINVVDISE